MISRTSARQGAYRCLRGIGTFCTALLLMASLLPAFMFSLIFLLPVVPFMVFFIAAIWGDVKRTRRPPPFAGGAAA